MNVLQVPESQLWGRPVSVDGNPRDDRPGKKRRKYIARAWYVSFQSKNIPKTFCTEVHDQQRVQAAQDQVQW